MSAGHTVHDLGAVGPAIRARDDDAGTPLAAPLLPPAGYVPVLAPCFIHATHPEHGEEVTYVPGERLPQWVRDDLAAGALLIPEAKDAARLSPVPRKPGPAGRRVPARETT